MLDVFGWRFHRSQVPWNKDTLALNIHTEDLDVGILELLTFHSHLPYPVAAFFEEVEVLVAWVVCLWILGLELDGWVEGDR